MAQDTNRLNYIDMILDVDTDTEYCERCLDGTPVRLRRVTDEIWCREHYELWLDGQS